MRTLNNDFKINPPAAGLNSTISRNFTLDEDPFWKNRDHDKQILNEKRLSRAEEFQQSTPNKRNNIKKINPADMEPAGLSNLEKLKPSPYKGDF